MKSTLINSEKSEKPMYPRLMIDGEYGMVVLFEAIYSGTCLNAGTSNENVGQNAAYDSTDDDWSDYTGTITLEN